MRPSRSLHRSAIHDRAAEAFPVVKQALCEGIPRESNPRPPDYESSALSTELGTVVTEGVEPSPRVLFRFTRALPLRQITMHSLSALPRYACVRRTGRAHAPGSTHEADPLTTACRENWGIGLLTNPSELMRRLQSVAVEIIAQRIVETGRLPGNNVRNRRPLPQGQGSLRPSFSTRYLSPCT